jgi:eukaryotic-like serine/threonine-protein kinase
MSFAPGTRLGPYEITAKLGEGGMGVVFRAKDFHLGREVALKVLPEGFTQDPERLARFEREAKLLAQLNHPNIAQIHGLEVQGSTRALVMELVEGPTLAERLEPGSLPLDESLSIAGQIAEALEEAHEKGIVHRDLKPQNIKAPTEGKVKVLDFGLAKALDPRPTSQLTASELAHSPTVTLGATREGVILGTAAYMAPEQARGTAVDKRADIWAFGVVLYEMLSGGAAFAAATVPDTLAAVLTREIDWSKLPPSTPPAIRRLLRRCLERNPRNRLHDIADARIVLDEVAAGRFDEPASAASQIVERRTIHLSAIAAAAALAAALAFAAGWSLRRPPPAEPPAVAPDATVRKLTFEPGLEAEPSFSPDGNLVAYTVSGGGSLDIAVLPIAGGQTRRLVATDADEAQPAWSPDGSRIAYAAARGERGRLSAIGNLNLLTPYVQANGADLYLVPAAGGASQRLVENGAYPAWSPDGREIAFQSDRSGQWKIWRVSAQGGEPRPVTSDAEIDFMPSWSPDGRWIAFASTSGLRVAPADGSAPPHELLTARTAILAPRWSDDGRWIYFSWYRDGTMPSLWRLAFEPGAAGGTPARLERISLGESSDVGVAIGAGGRLLAWSKVEYAPDIWELDPASGSLRQITDTSCAEDYPHLAPDGRTLLVESSCGGGTGLWTIDLVAGTRERLTPPEIVARWPRWSPDGDTLAYVSQTEGGVVDLMLRFRRGLDARPLLPPTTPGERALLAPQWSPDGERLVFLGSASESFSTVGYLATVDVASRAERIVYDPQELGLGFPTFAGDGAAILFQLEGDGESRQLWSVAASGGEPRRITRGTLELSHPQTTPARPGEILVVVDHENLALVSERTGELTFVTHLDDSTLVVDYPSWGPDGKKVYFSISRRIGDLYLIENPEPAGATSGEKGSSR